MPASFYDPNDNERKRLLRATATDPDGSRRFTDTVGRSGFERIDGDLRVRNYDDGGIRFEQRGPNEWRSFDSTTPIAALQNPDRTGQIAPDRTGADRIARAISDGGLVDRGPQFAAQAAAARMGFERKDMPRGWQGNVHDFDHERSFGTAATMASRARGFGGPPTAIEQFGTPEEKARFARAIEDQRMKYLETQAAGGPMSAAGGTDGRRAAQAELDAIRLRRAQEADRGLQWDLADRDASARENVASTEWGARTTIGDRTARAQEYVADQARLGQVGAADAEAGWRTHAADAEERWRKAETEGANGRAATEWTARQAIGDRAASAQENVATTQGKATVDAATVQADAQKAVGLAEAGRPAWSPNGRAVATTGEDWTVTQTEQPPAPEPQTGRYAMGKDGTIYDTTTGQRAEGLSEAQTIDIQLGELRKPPTGYVSKEDLAFRQKQIEALEKRKKELEEEERARQAGGGAPVGGAAGATGHNTDYR